MPPAKRTIALRCRACGAVSDAPISLSPRHGAFDPWFGLPLWLQAPCCGEVLWAWNRGHLDFLRQYVTASLREREPNLNRSMASRLPRWIKAAKNRDEIVRCIERLTKR